MNRFFKKSIVLMALVGGVAFSTGTAEAALTMQLTSYNAANVLQATTGVINDNAALDSAGLIGVVTFAGALGDWSVNVDTGIGNPVFPDQPHMDLAWQAVGGPALGVGDYLVIDFTETNAVAASDFNMAIGGTNSVSLLTGFNTLTTSSDLLRNGVSISGAAMGPFTEDGSFSQDSTAGAASSPYALTMRLVLTKAAAAVVINGSGDYEIQGTPAVPEPAMLSLLSLGLAGAAAVRRRRQATK